MGDLIIFLDSQQFIFYYNSSSIHSLSVTKVVYQKFRVIMRL